MGLFVSECGLNLSFSLLPTPTWPVPATPCRVICSGDLSMSLSVATSRTDMSLWGRQCTVPSATPPPGISTEPSPAGPPSAKVMRKPFSTGTLSTETVTALLSLGLESLNCTSLVELTATLPNSRYKAAWKRAVTSTGSEAPTRELEACPCLLPAAVGATNLAGGEKRSTLGLMACDPFSLSFSLSLLAKDDMAVARDCCVLMSLTPRPVSPHLLHF